MTIKHITQVVLLWSLLLPTFSAFSGTLHEVEIRKYKFIPQEIIIKAGDQVRWVNHEKRQYHSVWFEQLGEEEPDYFFPDETYERVFDQPSVLPYRCGPHPEMTGVVRVQ